MDAEYDEGGKSERYKCKRQAGCSCIMEGHIKSMSTREGGKTLSGRVACVKSVGACVGYYGII